MRVNRTPILSSATRGLANLGISPTEPSWVAGSPGPPFLRPPDLPSINSDGCQRIVQTGGKDGRTLRFVILFTRYRVGKCQAAHKHRGRGENNALIRAVTAQTRRFFTFQRVQMLASLAT